MGNDSQEKNPVLVWLKIFGFLPPLITVTYKGWIPLWLAIVSMVVFVVGLVFGLKRIIAGVVLPVFSVAIFAVVYSDGDNGRFAGTLSTLAVLAFVLLGLWFMLGGPLKRRRN